MASNYVTVYFGGSTFNYNNAYARRDGYVLTIRSNDNHRKILAEFVGHFGYEEH